MRANFTPVKANPSLVHFRDGTAKRDRGCEAIVLAVGEWKMWKLGDVILEHVSIMMNNLWPPDSDFTTCASSRASCAISRQSSVVVSPCNK